jgi:hypothetical protein
MKMKIRSDDDIRSENDMSSMASMMSNLQLTPDATRPRIVCAAVGRPSKGRSPSPDGSEIGATPAGERKIESD